LFTSYNRLVSRLAALEAEHADRARDLEDQIRSATETLLEQHASLARAERLAAVGETTAGLAHELRNPLAGIRVALANLRQDVGDPDLVARIDAVASEIDRLGRLVQDALSAVRHAPEPVRRVDLGDLIADLLRLVRYQSPSGVALDHDVADDLACELPADRIRQALLNLVLNAVHALDGHEGTVTVRARLEEDRLVLEVEDDGPGFPPGMVDARIRPFFAPSASGTGLGLAMTRRVAVDLGGELRLANLEPHGALARLVIPRHHG
jgi:signal transduction histidine kinase